MNIQILQQQIDNIIAKNITKSEKLQAICDYLKKEIYHYQNQ